MRKLAILCALLAASCAGGSQPKGTPKFKAGDQVAIGPFEVPGQVLEADCAASPCKYAVRYLPPPNGQERDFRKETFDEVELKPYQPR